MAAAESGDGSDGNGMRTITLVSLDNDRFEVSEAAASVSQTIRNMIEDGCADDFIPLPNVAAKVLAKVLEYCNKHAAAAESSKAGSNSSDAAESSAAAEGSPSAAAASGDNSKELKSFDEAFIDVDQAMLYDLLMAANYLDIKGLMDLACQKVADMIKGKTPEEIRRTFGIEKDFTPEEEEEIRKKNQWVFDE